MGLDAWVYAVRNKYVADQGDVDVKLWSNKEKDDNNIGCLPPRVKKKEVFYWRKHHNLHQWMENLYRSKGGSEDSFNCASVRLTKEDIDDLEKDILSGSLPETWGNSDDRLEEDVQFLLEARKFLKKGYAIFYDSWW